jgi:CPA1 family monovalent cation:H+ antiporter
VPTPPARQTFIVGWTGMRGVISLAAAIALPRALADGSPFAQRPLIIFLAFSVILVTLVLQGLTLPPVIRALGLAGAAGRDPEEDAARRAILEAAIGHLETVRKSERGDFVSVVEDVELHYQDRLATLTEVEADVHSLRYRRYIDLSRELLQVERQTAIRLRNQGEINDELLRQIERELDLDEARFLPGDA